MTDKQLQTWTKARVAEQLAKMTTAEIETIQSRLTMGNGFSRERAGTINILCLAALKTSK